jgi:hypothetical protein
MRTRALAALALAGCQLAVGTNGIENRPRKAARARVAVFANGPALGAATLDALAAQPNIDASLLPEGGDEGNTPCERAAAGGFDYLAGVALSVTPPETKCVSYEIGFNHRCASSVVVIASHVVANLSLVRVDRCPPRPKSSIHRFTEEKLREAGEPGVARATAVVLASLPKVFANLLPDQFVLDDSGRVPTSSRGDRGTDGVFADYRDGRKVGTLRVTDAGAADERHDRLICCFDSRPGDLLFRTEPANVIEIIPTFSGARLLAGGTAHEALGYGFTFGLRDLAGGWQGGLELDQLFTAHTNQVLGTIEAGYGFRPSTRWAVSLVAGGGGSFTARRNSDVEEPDGRSVHGLALARAQVQPGRQWFLRLDLGYIWSSSAHATAGAAPETFQLRGPLFRVGAGLL